MVKESIKERENRQIMMKLEDPRWIGEDLAIFSSPLLQASSNLFLLSWSLLSKWSGMSRGEKLPKFWHRTCLYRQRIWLGAYRVEFELGGNSWCDSYQVDATRIIWSSREEWGSHRRSLWALMRPASWVMRLASDLPEVCHLPDFARFRLISAK